jgi:type IX secretion system PorP/SprF family membrane protein
LVRNFYFLLIFFLVFFLHFVNGQQIPQFSQYMLNPYLMNPAVAGTTDLYHINAAYRKQWAGVTDAPVTFYLSGHGHVGKEHPRLRGIHKNQNTWHNGLGFILMADQTGPTSNNYFSVTYSYDMSLSKAVRLSFGLSAGLQQFILDNEKIKLRKETSPVPVSGINRLMPDFNFGVWMYHKLWYMGVSFNHLLSNNINTTPFPDPTGVNRLSRHYFITAGCVLQLLRDPVINLIPSFVIKSIENRPNDNKNLGPWNQMTPLVDFNLKITFKQIRWEDNHLLWAGVSYRTQEGIVAMIGARLTRNIDFGYAYDYTLSALQPVAMGSHELMVGYRIVPNQRILSPSDFWY